MHIWKLWCESRNVLSAPSLNDQHVDPIPGAAAPSHSVEIKFCFILKGSNYAVIDTHLGASGQGLFCRWLLFIFVM